jgi:hypothetical protein
LVIIMAIGFLTRLWYSAVHPVRTDWEPWENAHTLTEIGEVTAGWLEGRVDRHPGYGSDDGPDPETTELVPVLAAANRAGYVTEGSQPGEPAGPGWDGATWEQRAAVTGFCDAETFFALADLAHEAGLLVRVRAMPPRRRIRLPFSQLRREWGILVTRHAGQWHTDFGTPLSWEDIALNFWACPDDALEALAGAWQVTIVDPCWGRNDRVWSVLARFAGLAGLYPDRHGSVGCWTCGCVDSWNVYDCGCDNPACRCSGPSPLHDFPDSPWIRCRDLTAGMAIYGHGPGDLDGLPMDVTDVTPADWHGLRTITGITAAGEVSFRWGVTDNLQRATLANLPLADRAERERLSPDS